MNELKVKPSKIVQIIFLKNLYQGQMCKSRYLMGEIQVQEEVSVNTGRRRIQ